MKSVLQYVQGALNIMDSDQVDSIADTVESMQVAHLFADIFQELMVREDWEWLQGPLTLTALANPSFPTGFTVSPLVRRIDTLWYDVATSQLRKLCYLDPECFLQRFRNGQQSGSLKVVVPGQTVFHIRTDRQPTFWTTFNRNTIYMDAYDSGVESTLQTSKLSSFGLSTPSFSVADDFVPAIPEHVVPLVQHTLNAAASITFRQKVSEADEARVLRQLAQLRRKQPLVESNEYYSRQYGRRR